MAASMQWGLPVMFDGRTRRPPKLLQFSTVHNLQWQVISGCYQKIQEGFLFLNLFILKFILISWLWVRSEEQLYELTSVTSKWDEDQQRPASDRPRNTTWQQTSNQTVLTEGKLPTRHLASIKTDPGFRSASLKSAGALPKCDGFITLSFRWTTWKTGGWVTVWEMLIRQIS